MHALFHYVFCSAAPKIGNFLQGGQQAANYFLGNIYNPLDGSLRQGLELLLYLLDQCDGIASPGEILCNSHAEKIILTTLFIQNPSITQRHRCSKSSPPVPLSLRCLKQFPSSMQSSFFFLVYSYSPPHHSQK